MKFAIFSAVATTACLTGCASVAKHNCTPERVEQFASTDFETNKYGRSLSQYEGMCSSNGFTLDAATYQSAWKKEQSLYCTAEHAIRLGEVGKDYGLKYSGQCTNFNAEMFEANLSRGERLRPYTLEVAKWRKLLGDRRTPLEQAATDIQITEAQFNDLDIGPNDALAIVVTDIVADILLRGRWERKLDEANAAKFEFVRSGYGEGPKALADFHAQRVADYERNAVAYKSYMSAAAASAKVVAWAEKYLGEAKAQPMTSEEFRMPSFVFTGRWPTELGVAAPQSTAQYDEASGEGKFLKALGLKDLVGTKEEIEAVRAETEARMDTHRVAAPETPPETAPSVQVTEPATKILQAEAAAATVPEAVPAPAEAPVVEAAMVAASEIVTADVTSPEIVSPALPAPEAAVLAEAAKPEAAARTIVAVAPASASKPSSYASDLINGVRNRNKD